MNGGRRLWAIIQNSINTDELAQWEITIYDASLGTISANGDFSNGGNTSTESNLRNDTLNTGTWVTDSTGLVTNPAPIILPNFSTGGSVGSYTINKGVGSVSLIAFWNLTTPIVVTTLDHAEFGIGDLSFQFT
jgi:hypothetical protein